MMNLPDIKLSDFSAYTYNELLELCEFNPLNDLEILNTDCEGTRYLRIGNVFKNPLELREFVMKFPTEDKNRSLLEGEGESFGKSSKSPGMQQPLERQLIPAIGNQLYFIARRLNFIKFNKEHVTWKYFTNIYYPGMTAFNRNYLPHVDPFSLAANSFLTDSPTTATAFFRVKDRVNGKYYYGASEIYSNPDTRERHIKNLKERYGYCDKGFADTGLEPWVKFDGDDYYEKYLSLPADFNSCYMYWGKKWHSVNFDAEKETKIRYSIVSVIE